MDIVREIIGPDKGADALQLCVRAVFLFAFGVMCIRIAGRRTFAQYSPLDIIVALIAGSNLSRVMTGEVPVLPAMAATLVLVILHRLLALATLRWDWLSSLIKDHPIPLIDNGKVDRLAMMRANLSDEDLDEALRLEGVQSAAKVKLAMVEGNGKVSVIPKSS